MLSHLRAVLLATGTLVVVGMLHSVATVNDDAPITIALVPGPVAAPGDHSAHLRAVTGASMRAIAIGY